MTLTEMAEQVKKEWDEGPGARMREFKLQAIAPLARKAGMTPAQALALFEKTKAEIRARR